MATLIHPDGSTQEVSPKNKRFTIHEYWDIVGGYVERVKLKGRSRYMWVDEDGFGKGLRHNPAASKLAEVDIVGVALITEKGA